MTTRYQGPKDRRGSVLLAGNATLETAVRRCDRLGELVQLQQNQFVRYNHVFDFRDLLQSTALPYGHLAKAKGVGFKVSYRPTLPRIVRGDSVAISRVFEELITNCLLYTPKGGGIWLVGNFLGLTDGRLWVGLTIIDTGPGLSLAQQLQLNTLKVSPKPPTTQQGLGFALVSHYMHYLEGSIDIYSHVHGTVIRCLWPLGVVEEGTEQATQRRIIVIYRSKTPPGQKTWVTPLQNVAHQAGTRFTGASVDVTQGAGSLFGFSPGYESAATLAKPTSAARRSKRKLPSTNPVDHQLAGHLGIKPLWALASSPSANLFCGTAFNRSPASFELTTSSGPAKYPITNNILSDSRSTGQHPLATVLLNVPRASAVFHQTPVKIAQDRPDPPRRPMRPQWVEATAPAKSKIYYTESGLGYFKEPEGTRKRVGSLRVPASWAADVQAMAEQDEWIRCSLGEGSDRPLTDAEIAVGIKILKTDPHPIRRQAVKNVLRWQCCSEGMMELDPSVAFHLWCAYLLSTYTDPDDGVSIASDIKEFFMEHFFQQFLCLPPTAVCFLQDQTFLEACRWIYPRSFTDSSTNDYLEHCTTSIEATIYLRLSLIMNGQIADEQTWYYINQAIEYLTVSQRDYPALQRVEEYLSQQPELLRGSDELAAIYYYLFYIPKRPILYT